MNETTEAKTLAVAGAGFVMLALIFLWRELALPRELMLLGATLLSGAAVAVGRPVRWAGPAALLAVTAVAAGWYLAVKDGAVLPSLAVALGLAVFAVHRTERREPALEGALAWYALGAAALASSWAFYFHYLTAGVAADSVGRRLVLTLVWLTMGLAVVVRRWRSAAAAQRVGVALAACALVKAIAYDTTHLQGSLRIAALAAVGALLMGAAWLRARREAV